MPTPMVDMTVCCCVSAKTARLPRCACCPVLRKSLVMPRLLPKLPPWLLQRIEAAAAVTATVVAIVSIMCETLCQVRECWACFRNGAYQKHAAPSSVAVQFVHSTPAHSKCTGYAHKCEHGPGHAWDCAYTYAFLLRQNCSKTSWAFSTWSWSLLTELQQAGQAHKSRRDSGDSRDRSYDASLRLLLGSARFSGCSCARCSYVRQRLQQLKYVWGNRRTPLL